MKWIRSCCLTVRLDSPWQPYTCFLVKCVQETADSWYNRFCKTLFQKASWSQRCYRHQQSLFRCLGRKIVPRNTHQGQGIGPCWDLLGTKRFVNFFGTCAGWHGCSVQPTLFFIQYFQNQNVPRKVGRTEIRHCCFVLGTFYKTKLKECVLDTGNRTAAITTVSLKES